MKYCRSEDFRGAFNHNHYIVIQIDTDISAEHPAYGIAHQDATGRIYSPAELVQLVQLVSDKLIEQIGDAFYQAYRERVIFVICVHQIECWLLPLYWTDGRREKIVRCLQSLNEQLGPQFGFTIEDKAKDPRLYRKAAKPYVKQRMLRQHWQANPSLAIFINNLEQRFYRGFAAPPA
jgi:hypothetical protein